jgi:predicted HTH transcriptional regulator
MNSDGGVLIVGVADNGDLIGLENEINKFYKNNDSFLLHVKNAIKNRIGEQFYPFIDYRLVELENKVILYVECLPSNSAVYVDSKDFYVRTNPATDKLEGPKLVSYINNHQNFLQHHKS